MKKLFLFILITALLLSGCAVGTAETPEEPAPQPVPEIVRETAPPIGAQSLANTASAPLKRVITKSDAAEKLNALGIMKGALLDDGTVDYLLDEPLSRETALVLIVRALGHDDAGDEAYPVSPFTDVDPWAEGAVNYAYARGITKGVSSDKLGSIYNITTGEYATMLLRALGYDGDFYFADAYDFALEKGVISEVEGESITRGDAAQAIYALLGGSVKGSEEPIVESLLITGKVTAEAVETAGLSEIVGSADESLLTADEVYAKNCDKLFAVNVYDRKGELLRTVHGVFTGDNIALAAYDDIYGAARITFTYGGAETEVYGINFYDEPSGIVCLSYYTEEVHPHFEEPVEPETENVYILSSIASSEEYDGAFPYSVRAARPVVDAMGNFVGLTQRGSSSLKTVFDWYWSGTVSLRDFGAEHWPELLYPRGLDPTKKMIAITFDDGPSRSLTPKFLDLLEQYGAVATFFECGNMLKANPQFLERMEELGCEVGNHTYSHPNLNSLSQEKVKAQISDTDAIIEEKLGHKATVVRAPYGNSNAKVREAVDRPLIYWTIDTLDWQSRNADAVFKKIVDSSFDGAIVLMHSIHEPTYRACVKAIPWLIENGYQLVTVSEMAECRGYELENGTVYYSFKPQ